MSAPAALAVGAFLRNPKDTSKLAILAGEKVLESASTASRTPEPTSREFEEYFSLVLDTALADKQRRLVIVIDNLDRVASKELKAIWTTLRTFTRLAESVTGRHTNLCIIVPFDPKAIGSLWDEVAFSGPGASELLDKTFDLRFELPLPIPSDWRALLKKLMSASLPKHSSEEVDDACQVFVLLREALRPAEAATGTVLNPSPRELKSFVNQVGTLHQQWPISTETELHEFKLSHLACFVTLRRFSRDVAGTVLSKSLPSSVAIWLGADVYESLAALCFNVPKSLGYQMLLAEPAFDAMTSGDVETLTKLVGENADGFWANVSLVNQRIMAAGGPSLERIIQSVGECPVLGESGSGSDAMNKVVRTRIAGIEAWEAPSGPIGRALATLVSRDPGGRTAEAARRSIQKTILSAGESRSDDEVNVEYHALEMACAFADALLARGQNVEPIFHGATGGCWLGNLSWIEENKHSAAANHLVPFLSAKERVVFLERRLTQGYDDLQLAIQTLATEDRDVLIQLLRTSWNLVVSEDKRRARNSTSAILALWKNGVRDKSDEKRAESILAGVGLLATLAGTGRNEVSTSAYLLFLMFWRDLPVSVPSAAKMRMQRFITEFESSQESELSEDLRELLINYDLVAEFVEYACSKPDCGPLVFTTVLRLFDSATAVQVPLDLAVRMWRRFQPDPVNSLGQVLNLATAAEANEYFTAAGFDTALLPVYDVWQASDSFDEVAGRWMDDGLRSFGKEQWDAVVRNQSSVVLDILKRRAASKPTKDLLEFGPLADALLAMTRQLDTLGLDVSERFQDIVDTVSNDQRSEILAQLAVELRSKATQHQFFLGLHLSEELADYIVKGAEFPEMFRTILEEGAPFGTRWLAEVVWAASQEVVYAVDDGIRRRLSERAKALALSAKPDEEVRQQLLRIADRLTG